MASIVVLGLRFQVKYLGQLGHNLTVCAFPSFQVQHLVSHAIAIAIAPFFDVVILHAGTNNISSAKLSVKDIVGHFACLFDVVRDANVNASVFVSAVLPRHADNFSGSGVPTRLNENAQAVNTSLRELCRAEGVGFSELWDQFLARQLVGRDGLHLSEAGNRALGSCYSTLFAKAVRVAPAYPVVAPVSAVVTAKAFGTEPVSAVETLVVLSNTSFLLTHLSTQSCRLQQRNVLAGLLMRRGEGLAQQRRKKGQQSWKVRWQYGMTRS
jgi:GDSL-like Lipase/Acylhydrolase family